VHDEASDSTHAACTARTTASLDAGVYLTDGVFLYRIAGFDAGMIEVEDCYHLDRVRLPVTGVRARQLQVVTPRQPDR
jgi:hypothetical protein